MSRFNRSNLTRRDFLRLSGGGVGAAAFGAGRASDAGVAEDSGSRLGAAAAGAVV